MDQAALVYTTWPSVVEAEAAGAALVEAGLAACVNILPGVRSVYRWQGAVERATETVMIVKTRAARTEAVAIAIRARHPYDTPAILVVPVTGGEPGYLAWIAAETAD
ncbi:divalent-cation tolerance protein CutA [Blastochloris sulfoviridis]|uniref:Divalent-cation tolerance protein CutA n=1 Tax=Blastochloris sulfoviridis TaxID=50712 RepID=A0A5M6I799_9HYPH|nr:divalent-cation tolerance protein CutA [Blastochloris sulfoviridis]KAA5603599.1 divalent-cation tolerance protein CutA [Blastochloris sulfoviridis]